MRKILIYGQYMRGLENTFRKRNLEVSHVDKDILYEGMEQELQRTDSLFSFNFEPELAELCVKYDKKYISWVVDWPHSHIFAKVARNKNIYIFVFDRIGYMEALQKNVNNVFYLPLSPDVDYFDEIINNAKEEEKQSVRTDVSFMGNLYDSKEHSLYDQIVYLPPMVKGYLDGLMNAQKKVWGYTFVRESIRDDIWKLLHQYVEWDLSDKYDEVYEELLERMLCEKIAQEERREMCSLLAEHFSFSLYTKSNTDFDRRIKNCGAIDYFHKMPLLFRESKINVNITLHSIKSGIPLRCLDILACGGFLLSNYQPELAEYFVDGEELVLWQDFDDLIAKAGYYLEHEEERRWIAKAGYEKVKKLFHFDVLAGRMLDMISQSEGA